MKYGEVFLHTICKIISLNRKDDEKYRLQQDTFDICQFLEYCFDVLCLGEQFRINPKIVSNTIISALQSTEKSRNVEYIGPTPEYINKLLQVEHNSSQTENNPCFQLLKISSSNPHRQYIKIIFLFQQLLNEFGYVKQVNVVDIQNDFHLLEGKGYSFFGQIQNQMLCGLGVKVPSEKNFLSVGMFMNSNRHGIAVYAQHDYVKIGFYDGNQDVGMQTKILLNGTITCGDCQKDFMMGHMMRRDGLILIGKINLYWLIEGDYKNPDSKFKGKKTHINGEVCTGDFTGRVTEYESGIGNWTGEKRLTNGDKQIGIFRHDYLVEGPFIVNNWRGLGKKISGDGTICEGEFTGDKKNIYSWIGTRMWPNGIQERGRFEYDKLQDAHEDSLLQ